MTEPSSTHGEGESIHHLEAQRRENRDAIEALGINPYGSAFDGLSSVTEARRAYDERADEAHKEHKGDEGFVDGRAVVSVAGRIMLRRDTGKLIFMQIRDHSVDPENEDRKDLQIAVSKRDCSGVGFDLAKIVDLGDIVVATGPLTRTRTGEITIWASELTMGTKSLAPPPEKWSGLQDVETRYRKRYIDLYANPASMHTAKRRAQIVSRIRRFLDGRGFLEVETPVLSPLAGGAAARPFHSHLNAMDMSVVMRIATELHLKRLLVGGMPRVYEVGRLFRNEGVDKQHNPEFTSVEVYQAFGSIETTMELTESMLRELAHWVAVENSDPDVESEDIDPSTVRLPFGELTIDYGSPFEVVTYADLFERALGFPPTDVDRAREVAREKGLKHEGMADVLVVNEVFEEIAERAIDPERPTFVTEYPSSLSPLARPHPERPEVAQRWDLFIAGMEIGPSYTELNNPDIQEAKFREQLEGLDDEETTFRNFDEDFIEALKVGMPPAGGLGLGIDRIVMLLTNQPSIRDVILFPFMRPVE
ncbi:MAG: lysine--tRNA ligase [Phycisphaerales bacterium JB043]